jgi:hypothetical protein
MRKILIAVLVIMGVMLAHAPKDEQTKDRPLFHQGTVKIQLSESAISSKNLKVLKFGEKYTEIGISSLDEIGAKIKAANPRVTHIEAKNKIEAKKLGLDRWITVDIPVDADVMAAVEEYKKDPNVSFAQPEYANYLMATPNDTYFANNWGHNNTKQLPAYVSGSHSGAGVGTVGFDANTMLGWDGNQGYGSSSIVIAIMDTGIDYDHPDIAANYIGGWDAAMNDTNPDDNEGVLNVSGHGTSCAGVAAGVINNGIGVSGVAGNCSLMAIKVLNSSGSLVGMANGAIYAGDNGADILSMSYGGNYQYGTDATADAAYTYAYNAGVTLLAATGNSGITLTNISYPANHPDIIGVGAAAPDNGRKTATSVDGETWWASQYCTVAQDDRAAVDFLAPTILPATDIVGTGGFDPGDYGLYFNGTSCATPYAAGFAALIKSHWPTYTPAEVRQAIIESAMDVVDEESTAGWDGKSGYGLIDIGNALVLLAAPIPQNLTYVLNSDDVTLNWDLPAKVLNNYKVYRDGVSIATVAAGTRTYLDSNRPYGSYEYYVTAVWSDNGESVPSNKVTVSYGTLPVISTPASISPSCALGSSTPSSFGITNSGQIGLTYSLTNAYVGYLSVGTAHSNDFQSVLGYTNSGTRTWALATGGTWNSNTQCAKVTAPTTGGASTGTGIMTSASFDGSTALYLDFDQTATLSTTSSTIKVEYYNGTAWVQLYYANTSVTGHQHIAIPVTTSNMQLRFTAVLVKSSGSSWSVDNIVVSKGTPYSWLTFNSPVSGTVTGGATNTINLTCNSAGLTAGTYEANITAASNDATNPTKVVNVQFVVGTGGTPPAAPSLATPTDASTLYILKPVFDWNDVSGATSYTILVDNNSDFSSAEINQTPAVSTFTPATDMALGTYYWKVLSTNSFGSSSYSGTWSVILAPLTAPINVITTPGATDITVSWDAVGGATSYDVYSATEPYGTYTLVTNVATNSYVTTSSATRLFWYVVAKN